MRLKIFTQLFKVYLQVAFSFRIEAWMWIVNGLITPLVSMAFWLKVSEGQATLEMSNSQLVTYFIFLTVVNRISQTWTGHWLSHHIKSGKISGYIIKPYRFEVLNLARDSSFKLLRTITLLPFIGILMWWFKGYLQLPIQSQTWITFGLALFLGFSINYLSESIIGMLGFFFTEIENIGSAWELITNLVSGLMIPIIMLPAALQTLAYGLYTRFILSFPLEIILGQVNESQILIGFGIGILWIVVLSILYMLLWRYGLKRYTGVGI